VAVAVTEHPDADVDELTEHATADLPVELRADGRAVLAPVD